MHPPYRFCPVCGGAARVRASLKPGEPERLVCTRCGFVFYLDPKIAVGTIIRDADGGIVLVRRASSLALASGCSRAGTSTAARRSSPPRSAKRAKSAVSTSSCTAWWTSIPTPARTPIIVVYAATIAGGTLCADDECLEARVFAADEIPWDDLAFRSTYEALKDYFGGS